METETKPQAKKEWTDPELIMLVRGDPEEMVLAPCKYGIEIGAGPGTIAGNCTYLKACNTMCLDQTSS